MSVWDNYPSNYRDDETQTILRATSSGDSVAVVGLSGSGKSNLLGFLANRIIPESMTSNKLAFRLPKFIFIDCNRLTEINSQAFFELLNYVLPKNGDIRNNKDQLLNIEKLLRIYLNGGKKLCLMFDRFDALFEHQDFPIVSDNLRALRDAFKYQLTYVIAARKPLDPHTELAELFFGHTLWLGPLSRDDALWSAKRDTERFTGDPNSWSDETLAALVDLSWGYPSLLRACCEAYASGLSIDLVSLSQHPSVIKRVEEFWSDDPGVDILRKVKMLDHPLLQKARSEAEGQLEVDRTILTAKENLLLEYLISKRGNICEKDDIVKAVWPEDVIYEVGVRDDSLAQLIRRLRIKIEPDASNPQIIQTIPGRGYIFRG